MRKRGRRGAGSITKRGARWQAQWSGGHDGAGKRIRRSATFILKRDAEWWLREASRGAAPEMGLTVAEYLERWLAGKRSVRESTRAQYTNHVRIHLIPVLGAYRLTDLTRRHIEAFVEDRSRHVSTGTKRRLSASTVRALVVTLRNSCLHRTITTGLWLQRLRVRPP